MSGITITVLKNFVARITVFFIIGNCLAWKFWAYSRTVNTSSFAFYVVVAIKTIGRFTAETIISRTKKLRNSSNTIEVIVMVI